MDNIASNEGNVSDKRKKIVNYAKSFVGHPYVWGGTKLCENWTKKSGCGVDCSAFVQAIYKHFGYEISRTTDTQINDGKKIKESQLKPGDLILYDGHVAMYIGNGAIVHASNKKDGVKISDNYRYGKEPIGYRRIIND